MKLGWISQAWGLLDSNHERRDAVRVSLLAMAMAIFEALGVVSVTPFLAVLGDPSAVERNLVLFRLREIAAPYGVDDYQSFLMLLGCLSFLMIVFSAGFRMVTHFQLSTFIERRRHFVAMRLLSVYINKSYLEIKGLHTSEVNKIILSEVDQVIAYVVRPLVNLVSNLAVVFLLTALLIYMNPILSLLVSGVLGGAFLLAYISLRDRLRSMGIELLNANTDRFVAASNTLDGIKDIKIFGMQRPYLERFRQPSESYTRLYTKNVILEQLPKYIIEAVAFGGLIAIVVAMVWLSGNAEGDALAEILPTIGLYAFAAYRLQPAFQAVYSAFSNLTFGERILQNVTKSLAVSTTAVAYESRGKSTWAGFADRIDFRGVGFGYPRSARPVLHGINVSIKRGSCVAVVGRTGSGKSTFVDLLLGLLPPSSGGVYVDECLITPSNAPALHQIIGYLPQDIFFTDASIAENIAFGLSTDEIDYEKVRFCAEVAMAHEFIDSLPDRYETKIGQRGNALSGGQRQRLGLARSLYREPDLLVLDEATSALDVETERQVLLSIQKLAKSMTIVMVAHRLETIKFCDDVIAFEEGTLVDSKLYFESLRNGE